MEFNSSTFHKGIKIEVDLDLSFHTKETFLSVILTCNVMVYSI